MRACDEQSASFLRLSEPGMTPDSLITSTEMSDECVSKFTSLVDSVENTNCTWICPKCDFFNFSDSFFTDQLNLENENRFDPWAYGSGTKASQTGSDKNKFITGLKFVSININSIRGKKLELLAFLDFHQPQIVAIQETKIDSSISTSELFPESCPYNVYRKDRTLDGGGVMLLIHKDISRMPITELENDSESIWVKVFANKTSHFVASWYRPPGGDLEKLDSQLKSLKKQLEKIKDNIKAINPPQSIFWVTSTFVTLFGQTDSANQVHH